MSFPLLRFSLGFLCAVAAFAAGDEWQKVQDLKSGSEIRIYRKGERQPLSAVFSEASAERVVVIVKNAQSAIAKDDIDRLDARPSGKSAPRVTSQTTTKNTDPDYTIPPTNGVPVPGSSSSTSYNVGSSKPAFATVYVRPATK